MDIRKRIIGPCARPVEGSPDISLVPSVLATNLLIFENYILDSCRFMEFPQIVSAFGFSETVELLKSRSIKIRCDPSQIVIMGSTPELVRAGKAFTYEFTVVRANDHEEHIHLCFKWLGENSGLPQKQLIKLKGLIAERLDLTARDPNVVNSPELKALRALLHDLSSNVPNVKKAVVLALRDLHNIHASPTDFSVKLHQIREDTVKAETNIPEVMNLSETESHEIIQRALFRLAAINQSLAYMERFSALCGYNDKDLSIFEEKLNFLAREYEPDAYASRFNRVLEIKGFPDVELIAQEGRLRLDKILEIRETKEGKEFREWLAGLNSVTDDEMREQLESFKTAAGNFLAGMKGKALRLLITSGVGLVPVVGNVVGTLASALDSFIVEKILPSSGPVSFVNNLLPSAFEVNKMRK